MDFEFPKSCERWGLFEVSCQGHDDKNPFVDYSIQGIFTHRNEKIQTEGFYDGNGTYKVRFMPSFIGNYSFEVHGSFSEKPYKGEFSVEHASGDNHGPVRVANTFHFAYEDGKPYYPIGTTCYVWELQNEELHKITLETLSKGYFNKIRFCLFPKHYDYNLNEPRSYPYEGSPMDSSILTSENFQNYVGAAQGNNWDFKRLNPEHFQHIDKSIAALRDLSIEADLIVMHPYDRWGFSLMSEEEDDIYWKYVIARYAAFRNVWWSLANEYDLMPQKKINDWERYASIVLDKDPYRRLRSIHNCQPFYDYSRPWITHCCIQRQDIKYAEFVSEYRQRYGKPIVLDEIAYEGNIQHGWGNISGKEMVRRFWEVACRGGYAGHGETYMHPQNILWWSHGGKLHGESPERLKFLHRILKETPGYGLAPMQGNWDEVAATVEQALIPVDYHLYYYSFRRPSFRDFYFNDEKEYHVEVIDTWEMSIEDRGFFKGKFRIELPGKEYMAIRIRGKETL